MFLTAVIFHQRHLSVWYMPFILQVLCKVFYQPMVREKLLPDDLMTQIFANLEEMTMLHCELNQEMKRVKKSPGLIGKVGDVILRRFTGEHGSNFRTAAAAFCHNQSSGLEALKISQHKNARLVQFLHEASANPLCRRLELKDIIPTGMQRLTKYPLLLESLLKYTPSNKRARSFCLASNRLLFELY